MRFVPPYISYSSYFLSKLQYTYGQLESSVIDKLKSLNIFQYRRCRGGKRKRRNISTKITLPQCKHRRIELTGRLDPTTACDDRKRSLEGNLTNILSIGSPPQATRITDRLPRIPVLIPIKKAIEQISRTPPPCRAVLRVVLQERCLITNDPSKYSLGPKKCF